MALTPLCACQAHLRLKRKAGKHPEGPGDLFLILSQGHCAGAVDQDAAFLQQLHCLKYIYICCYFLVNWLLQPVFAAPTWPSVCPALMLQYSHNLE